jgi:predicted lipoprotein with Yx(FWY)xxD motif
MALKHKSSNLVWLVVVLVVITIAGATYFILKPDNSSTNNQEVSQSPSSAQTNKTTETKKEENTSEITITTGDSEFGTILFDGRGQAIYIWELEDSTKAECYDSCAEAWPPVLTDGAPIAAGDTKSELLGTTKRTDGTTQVTYNGHPLYYYAHEGSGEVKCHNISTHGGLWWVIQPSGNRAE